jgi:hypothetical protein
LNLHLQLFSQDLDDGLGILHDLLGVLGRHETDAQRFHGFARITAGEQCQEEDKGEPAPESISLHNLEFTDTEWALAVQTFSALCPTPVRVTARISSLRMRLSLFAYSADPRFMTCRPKQMIRLALHGLVRAGYEPRPSAMREIKDSAVPLMKETAAAPRKLTIPDLRH